MFSVFFVVFHNKKVTIHFLSIFFVLFIFQEKKQFGGVFGTKSTPTSKGIGLTFN